MFPIAMFATSEASFVYLRRRPDGCVPLHRDGRYEVVNGIVVLGRSVHRFLGLGTTIGVGSIRDDDDATSLSPLPSMCNSASVALTRTANSE